MCWSSPNSQLTVIFPVFAQDADEELTELLEEYLYDDEPGVVIYTAYEDEVWVANYGLANLETGEDIAIDDLFRIASVTKPLVATIVLQLLDEGELELDDLIADYLPDDTEYGLILNHDGATSGFQSIMAYIPDEDIVVVILTNDFDFEIMEDLYSDVLNFMYEDERLDKFQQKSTI